MKERDITKQEAKKEIEKLRLYPTLNMIN